MSGKIINLRGARKQKARADKRAQGDENAARHGQSKSVKKLHEAQLDRERRTLDGKKRDQSSET